MIPVWVSLDGDKGVWTKKMLFPALPPIGTMLNLVIAPDEDGGVICVASLWFDESRGNYFCFADVEESADYEASGWERGYYYDLMEDWEEARLEQIKQELEKMTDDSSTSGN